MLGNRALLELSLGIISLLLDFAAAIVLFVLTASISVLTHQKEFALLLVSAVVETLVCFSTLFLVFWVHWKRPLESCGDGLKRRFHALCLFLGALPWLTTAVMGAVAFGISAVPSGSKFFESNVKVSALGVWTASLLFQAIYLIVLAFARSQVREEESNANGALQHPMEECSGSETPVTGASNPFFDKLPSPPSLSPLDGNSSLRSSFFTNRRPASSKKNFSIRSSSQPRQSERSSSDGPSSRPSQDEGFDAWDTSDLSTQMKETVLQQSKPLAKCTGLPTIPGSRSPSPAKALEGPFLDPSPERTPPRSPLPQPPVSQPASPTVSEAATFTTRFPPPIVTSFTNPSSPPQRQSQRFSRPPSLKRRPSGEDHIHPLFRCNSPTPPPSASPTTVVTAAPEAGEVIDRRTLHRMRSTSQRSSSQPPAVSPLRRSESFANARSNKVPLSPSISGPGASTPSTPKPMHQRKRSASFEGCIIRPALDKGADD